MSAVSHQPSAPLSASERTTNEPRDEERRHLVFGISSEVDQVLDDLASRYGVDQAEVLNSMLGLLKYLSDRAQQGKRVGIAANEQELETEITGL